MHGVLIMKKLILAAIFCTCLTSDIDAYVHGKFVQPSGNPLVTDANDPLTTGGGDPLVTQ